MWYQRKSTLAQQAEDLLFILYRRQCCGGRIGSEAPLGAVLGTSPASLGFLFFFSWVNRGSFIYFLNLYFVLVYSWLRGFPGGSAVKKKKKKKSACSAGDAGSAPGWGRSSGRGHGYPLQYSCLENPLDRGFGKLQSMGSQRVGLSMHSWLTMNHWITLLDTWTCSKSGSAASTL